MGDGREMKSVKQAVLPARIEVQNVNIVTDVVTGDLPLLFSRYAMKKACTKMDFSEDTIEMFFEGLLKGKADILAKPLNKMFLKSLQATKFTE